MNNKRLTRLAALSVMVFLAGCFGGSGEKKSSAVDYVTVYTTKNSTGLIAHSSTEMAAYRILEMLYSGLVYITPDGKVENEMAKAIETADNRVWRITLRDDFKFSNGEQVTAHSFVDAWNFAAKVSNAMGKRDHLQNIEGFEKDGDTDLSGLKVISDYEFEVTLKKPNRNFKVNLAGSVFYPLPKDAMKDIVKYGLSPIGNGPYKFVSYLPATEAKLAKDPDYKGPRKPKNDGLHYKIYATTSAAYNDLLAGNLDVLDAFPAESLSKFKEDLPSRWLMDPVASTWYLVIRPDVPQFGQDEEGLLRRRAVSMVINRQEIADRLFFGSRTPAREFSAPMMSSYQDNLPGSDVLDYNPAKAKELWEQANAIRPWSGETLYLNYATDRGDKPLYEALANAIQDGLGIKSEPYANPDWKSNKQHGVESKQPFRHSWTADWPAPDTYLKVLFSSTGNSNHSTFTNAEYDALIANADLVLSDAEAAKEYQKAQEVLLNKLPVIPLFYSKSSIGWSDKVKDVEGDWSGLPVYYNVQKKQ